MSNVKNYTEQGGERTVIGGNLNIAPGGSLTFDGLELKPAQVQAASTAATVADLKTDFNALLTSLKAAGIMLTEGD
jgi:hypothetical protein